MPFKYCKYRIFAVFPVACLILVAQSVMAQASSAAPETGQMPGSEIWVGAPIVGDSPCETLAKRVCGDGGACSGLSACRDVQRWLRQEQQERAAGENPRRMTPASGQCQEADRDRQRYSTCSK